MTKTAERIALRARFVFPVSTPPIENGVVTIENDRVVAVEQNSSLASPRDLGNVALLPGLINCHTHLEFSELDSPLGTPRMPLPDWIDTVVTQRRAEADAQSADLNKQRHSRAIQAGTEQCLRTGTTTVGDIVRGDVGDSSQRYAALRCFEFHELIGLRAGQVAEQVEAARQYLTAPHRPSSRITRGLSPHAPYTAAPELVRQVAELARQQRLTVAMHLAESSEELRLLAHRDGPFRDLLERFGIWDQEAFPGGIRPLDYLRILQQAHRSLIIHGNFLTAEEWTLLARQRATMSVVYCPRTHHYFRHPRYPLEEMLRAGVRVVLGTDSRASNPDLNLFRELQFAARHHAGVEPQCLLRMVTLDAAEALGCADRVGSLERGKLADLAVVRLSDTTPHHNDPHTTLLADGTDARDLILL